MPISSRSAVVFLLLAASCIDSTLTTSHKNDPPSATITSPADGTGFYAGQRITVLADYGDGESSNDELNRTWLLDGLAADDATDVVTETGAQLVFEDGLAQGEHSIEIVVTDPDGDAGSDSVSVEVAANEAPTARFLAPSEDGTALYDYCAAFEVSVQVEDIEDDDDLSVVTLEWVLDGTELLDAPGTPDSDGVASFELDAALEPGERMLAVTPTDSLGLVGDQTAVAFTVDAVPEDLQWYADVDGDGFGDADSRMDACERPEGYVDDDTDCDDGDASVHPGAEELCDGIDNDCDGSDAGCELVYSYTGSDQSFEVPDGVVLITVTAWGGGGGGYGSAGAGGGYAWGELDVAPGESLTIIVGGGGANGESYGGGGAGTPYLGGGGMSAVVRADEYLLVAGGGGGASYGGTAAGGAGGGSEGADGGDGGYCTGGGGGASTGGGEAGSPDGGAGSAGQGGAGATLAAGGGGGFYGGGGGGGDGNCSSGGYGGGGGGGSSFVPDGGSTEVGSGSSPGGTGDPDHDGVAGTGGGYGVGDPEPGLLVVRW